MASRKLALAIVAAGVGMLLGTHAGTAQDSGLPPETLSQSTPVFAFQSQGSSRPGLVFVRSGNSQEHDPRVFLSSRDGWRLVQLPEEVHNATWTYAGRSTSGTEVWGITQSGGTGLTFVWSGNSGRAWRVRGVLQKVSPSTVIELFTLNEDRGTLILRLDEDSRPDAPRLGYYLYITKNGGRNWSEAIYSQGKPLPPPDLLARPDRTFDAKEPLDVAGWQRLLSELQPPG